jgi:hypothetical protein
MCAQPDLEVIYKRPKKEGRPSNFGQKNKEFKGVE